MCTFTLLVVFHRKGEEQSGLHSPATDAVGEERHIQPGPRGCQDRGATSRGDVKIVDPHNHGSSESGLVEDRCEGRGQICILYVRKVIVTFTSSQARLRSMVKDLYIPMES